MKTSIELSKSLSEIRSLNLTTRGGPACGSTQSGSRSQKNRTHLYGGFYFFVSVYLIRIGGACSIRTRKKIAPVKQFLTQITFLLVCELVITTRNKLYKGGDQSELALRLTQCLRVRPSPVINKMPFLSS